MLMAILRVLFKFFAALGAWCVGWLWYWMQWTLDSSFCFGLGVVQGVLQGAQVVTLGTIGPLLSYVSVLEDWFPIVYILGVITASLVFVVGFFVIRFVIKIVPTIG